MSNKIGLTVDELVTIIVRSTKLNPECYRGCCYRPEMSTSEKVAWVIRWMEILERFGLLEKEGLSK